MVNEPEQQASQARVPCFLPGGDRRRTSRHSRQSRHLGSQGGQPPRLPDLVVGFRVEEKHGDGKLNPTPWACQR